MCTVQDGATGRGPGRWLTLVLLWILLPVPEDPPERVLARSTALIPNSPPSAALPKRDETLQVAGLEPCDLSMRFRASPRVNLLDVRGLWKAAVRARVIEMDLTGTNATGWHVSLECHRDPVAHPRSLFALPERHRWRRSERATPAEVCAAVPIRHCEGITRVRRHEVHRRFVRIATGSRPREEGWGLPLEVWEWTLGGWTYLYHATRWPDDLQLSIGPPQPSIRR
jgi:hypothetical protein